MSTTQVIQKNKHKLKELPEPGDSWLLRDADLSESMLKKLRHRGVIWSEQTADSGAPMRHYTNKEAYQILQDSLENVSEGILPCGHHAFVNERDVDGLKCKMCEEVHPKEAVDL